MTENSDATLEGIDALDPIAAADANRPYGEVTAEDLDTDELVYDGADAADLQPDDATTPVDEAIHTDDDVTDTESIDERLAQEQPDPAAEVAYGFDETDTEGGLPDEPDATASDEA